MTATTGRTFWDHVTLPGDDESPTGHATAGITRTRYAECDCYGCQPVSAVPHEDSEGTADLILGLAVHDAIDFIRAGLTVEALDRMTRAVESAARVLGGGR